MRTALFDGVTFRRLGSIPAPTASSAPSKHFLQIRRHPMLSPKVSAHDHMAGPADAALVLVEYGDYQCPYCGQAFPIVREIQRRLKDQLCFVFRNFPLANAHPNAEVAAEAAEAAGAQGRFWEMHDVLYENQAALEPESLLEYGAALGLDMGRFTR